MTGDQFLSPPRGSSGRSYGTEARILRDRQAAHSDAMDREAGRSSPYSSARMLVQVYDGGSIPSAADRVYFTRPVLATGTETEGGAGTLTVDSATTVPVVVLGRPVVAGDNLIATSLGGRWVADGGACSVKIHVTCSVVAVAGDTVTILKGATTIATGTTDASGNVTLTLPLPLTNPYTLTATGGGHPDFTASQSFACGTTYEIPACGTTTTCSPCGIPNEDLTLSWTNILHGNGSVTLVYGGGVWASATCEDDNLLFVLECDGGTIELRAIFFTGGHCPTGDQEYCSNLRSPPLQIPLIDHTCSPFSVTFEVTETGCGALFGDGNTNFAITQ